MVLGKGFIDMNNGRKAFIESGLKRGVVLGKGFIDMNSGRKGFRENGLKRGIILSGVLLYLGLY